MPFYQILPTAAWNSTKLVLSKTTNDKRLAIEVDAGTTWTANSNPGGGGRYDARGWQGHKPGAPGYKVQSSDEGCLVGTISGTNFMFTFEAAKPSADGKTLNLSILVPGQLEGELQFGINDNHVLNDNAGEIHILSIKY